MRVVVKDSELFATHRHTQTYTPTQRHRNTVRKRRRRGEKEVRVVVKDSRLSATPSLARTLFSPPCWKDREGNATL